MKISHTGFAPIVLIATLAVLATAGAGTVAASDRSKPGDALFGLDRAIEELQVNLKRDDAGKAEARIGQAIERLEELRALSDDDQPVDPALAETQQALSSATDSVNEDKVTISAQDYEKLLAEIKQLRASYDELKVKVETKSSQVSSSPVPTATLNPNPAATQTPKPTHTKDEEKEYTKDGKKEDISPVTDDDNEVVLNNTLTLSGSDVQISGRGKTYTLQGPSSMRLVDLVGHPFHGHGIPTTQGGTTLNVVEFDVEIDGALAKSGDAYQITSGGKQFTVTGGGKFSLEKYVGRQVHSHVRVKGSGSFVVFEIEAEDGDNDHNDDEEDDHED